ncbi:protein BIG GRAIN 1-like B [Humulus lupulus]|uniref:protein BIG GRAIN 1-like B n=1 Tax=Humulus lupulus TaxID=3486 RepID=UPI002B40D606|nr:protein BIG GRAIN 1-like B [Humulus lupulus]
MESWDNNLQRYHHHHHRHRHRRENPSFSSTLLDAIYRSIDEGKGNEEGELILYRETMRKKQSSASTTTSGSLKQDDDGMVNFRRACMIEKWMEKKVSEKVVVRRNSVADFDLKSTNHHHHRDIMLLNSSSSSSESSCGGGFSSSESESFRTGSKSRSSSSCYSIQKPKPIRTSVSAPKSNQPGLFYDNHHQDRYEQSYNGGSAPKSTQKPKHENGFVKTKSKALKIYGDLKKVKQPISPGGRLASFLNSLFTTGNTKKTKIEELGSQRKSKSTNGSTTTCSSASSFSRSCLSNTPSSRGKFSSSSGAKRSVRFCPVSVIVDEDCRPCGHKSLHEEQESTAALMALTSNNVEQVGYYVVDDGHRRVQEVAIDLFKSYQKKNLNDVVGLKNDNNNDVVEFDMRDVVHGNDDNEAFEDDDDDDASCSSSDLFELDNLSAIGIERYREELPVYETTHFGTNRAIASGFIL